MKRKILMQACARKIQRVWKNYRTKKLINVYSNLSLKKWNKNKNVDNDTNINEFQYEAKKILNVRSCGFKAGKN